jgi:hypothetical protein
MNLNPFRLLGVVPEYPKPKEPFAKRHPTLDKALPYGFGTVIITAVVAACCFVLPAIGRMMHSMAPQACPIDAQNPSWAWGFVGILSGACGMVIMWGLVWIAGEIGKKVLGRE